MLQANYKLQLAKTKMLQANHELQPNCCNQAPMKLLQSSSNKAIATNLQLTIKF